MSWFKRCLLAFFLLFALPLFAQSPADGDWIYKGSDIPKDPAWQTGALPNGLRYAVRRNALPAGRVSIRVRIDAGALNEEDGERGWAHLIEHIAFRGTKSFDGKQAENILQQLGARPGSDTNASTDLTQTVYQLDLPKNDRELIATALNIMSEMVDSARFEDVAVDSERKIVLAERSLRLSQLAAKMDEVSRPYFYSGLKIVRHDIIGNEQTLAGATPTGLRAFYERWYRPELATVVIVGDADPAMLKELLVSQFGGWQGTGPAPAKPDYGAFTAPKDVAMTFSAAGAPNQVQLMWHRPHVERPASLEKLRFVRTMGLATTLINRRLEERARTNAPFLSASLGAGGNRFVGDTSVLAVSARDGRWHEALQEAYAILADALRAPPDAEEIARELSNMRSTSQTMVRVDPTKPSTVFAAEAVSVADGGSPPPPAAAGLEIFEAFAKQVTPAQIADATKEILSGVGPQIMLVSPEPVEGGAPVVATALASARQAPPAVRPVVKALTMDSLPKLGPAGKEKSRETIADMGVTIVHFANGDSLIHKKTDFLTGTVMTRLRIGSGFAAAPMEAPPPPWMTMLVATSGIGDVKFGDLQRLFTGRRIGLGMSPGPEGLTMSATTGPEDLPDQLRLFALQLAYPRWDEGEFDRFKTAMLQAFDQASTGTAGGRLSRDSSAFMHGGDPRWVNWSKEKIAATTAADRQRLVEARMTAGPLELVVVGDIGLEDAVKAAAASIGALPPRAKEGRVHAAPLPRANPQSQILTHKGDPGEAAVLIGWSNPGRKLSFVELRSLATAQNILRTRLTDRLRRELGATYSVGVTNSFSEAFPAWGVFMVQVQVKPENTDTVLRIAREEVADLAKRPVPADEFERSQNPAYTSLEAAMKTNAYWVDALQYWTVHPDLIVMHRDRLARLKSITPEMVRKAVASYVTDEGDWSMMVLPEKEQVAAQ